MAKYEDYVKQQPQGEGLQQEIDLAAEGQQERQRNPDTGQFVADTPDVNWEERYKELEKFNSRQAQTLGQYRQTIDEFISNPTPPAAEPQVEQSPITVEEIYEDPNAALNKAIANHPDIIEARRSRQSADTQMKIAEAQHFVSAHPDFNEIDKTPEFQNWVADNTARQSLYQRSMQHDYDSADALFQLFKAERGVTQHQQQADVQQAQLISSSGELVTEPPVYSRSEYIDMLTSAKQGDIAAEKWVQRNVAGYREALSAGNVRD
jgi:hypothetical protein